MSSEVSSTTESFSISCIPDGEEFAPNAEELESLYVMLENGQIPELQWQCPGRRAPSPVGGVEESSTVVESIEKEAPTKNDFDFMDDVALPQMRVRAQKTAAKSTKKKTADFAGVMESWKKQMQNQKESSN